MKKIDWYIIKKFLGTFITIMALMVVVIVVFDISERISTFLEKQIPVEKIVVDYYMNFIPYFVNMFSYLFIFITVIFFTSRLSSRSELVAILNSGMSFYRLTYPYILTAFFIGILNLLLANFLIPNLNKDRLAFERQYMRRAYINTNKDIHIQANDSTYYYVNSFNNTTETGNNFTKEIICGTEMKRKLSANLARYDSAKNKWILIDYVKRTLLPEGETIEEGNYLEVDLHLHPLDFAPGLTRVEEMNYTELNNFIKREKQRGYVNTTLYEYERFQRFLHPIASIILTVMGMALSAKKTKGDMGLSLTLGIVLTFLFILFMQMSKVFAMAGVMSVTFAALFPVLFYAGITVFILRVTPK